MNQMMKTDKGNTIEVKGCNVFYLDEGEGQTILFLHGNPDSSEVWEQQIKAFKSSYRCLAPDFPGWGQSSISSDFEFTLEGYSEFMAALLESLGITEPVHLVVHDIGGIYGLPWAVMNPDMVKTLTIMNTVFSPLYKWHFWGSVWRTKILGEISMAITSYTMFSREIKRGSKQLSEEQIRRTYDAYSSLAKKTTLKLYRASDPKLAEGKGPLLKDLVSKIPAQVVWGKHDPYIDEKFARLFYTDNVKIIEESGHWVQAECPDRVNKELRTLFESAE